MKTDSFYSRNILTDLLWSLLCVFVIMLLLSAVFCIAEGSAHPDKCSGFLQALFWVFASSVDAPVHWSNYEPQTATGQIIALLVGVVKVAIIAPTAANECTIGYFAYHVAFFGGFNFVSREFAEDGEGSYYTIVDSPLGCQNEFVSDIRQLSGTPEHWNIAMISSSDLYDTQVHLVSKVKQENGETASSVLHGDRFREFFLQLQEAMQQLEPAIRCDADESYKPVTLKNVIVRSGGGLKNNGFTMRVSYKVTTWNDHIVSAASSLATTISRYLTERYGKNMPANT